VSTYFPHAGPVEERIPGAPMHCRTILPNHDCPQLRAGCLGCTLNWWQTAPSVSWGSGAARLTLTLRADVAAVREALARADRSPKETS
jgi:hypothetical protein